LKQEDFPHFKVLEQLSSSNGWQVLAGKVITDISVSAVLKRLFIIEFKIVFASQWHNGVKHSSATEVSSQTSSLVS